MITDSQKKRRTKSAKSYNTRKKNEHKQLNEKQKKIKQNLKYDCQVFLKTVYGMLLFLFSVYTFFLVSFRC